MVKPGVIGTRRLLAHVDEAPDGQQGHERPQNPPRGGRVGPSVPEHVAQQERSTGSAGGRRTWTAQMTPAVGQALRGRLANGRCAST